MELELGRASSPVSRVRPTPASDQLGAGGDFGGGTGDTGLELATDQLDIEQRYSGRRSRAAQGPPSERTSSRIVVRRHDSERPPFAANLSFGILLVILLVLATPYFSDRGVARVVEILRGTAPAAFAALGVTLFGAWAYIFGRAFAFGSSALHLVSLAIVVEMAASAIVVGGLLSKSVAARVLQSVMPLFVPIASAAVTLGLAVFLLRCARVELRSQDRRVGLAVLFIFLGVLALPIGIRVARVDLALPLHGDSLDVPLWTPLF